MIRFGASLLAALAFAAATAAPAAAAPILVGSTVTFELLDDGVGIGDLTDTELIAAAGDGIAAGDGSNIGDGAMIDGEFIRIFDTSVSFSLFGGGAVVQPGFLTTGYGPAARYVLSDLVDPAVAQIVAVSVVLSDVINVALGSEVLFTADSVTLLLGTLGILESNTNLGLVTLNLTLDEVDDPNPPAVPEPGTLLLLGTGVAAVWYRRRASRRDVHLS